MLVVYAAFSQVPVMLVSIFLSLASSAKHAISSAVCKTRLLDIAGFCSKLCRDTINSGRGWQLAGFDAPFNMGSTECKIEWTDNFEATYLKN